LTERWLRLSFTGKARTGAVGRVPGVSVFLGWISFRYAWQSEMNNLQQILQMGQQVQARMSQLQTELGQKTVSVSTGGGMVTAMADGRGKLRTLKIDPTVIEAGDAEMLEDLVLAAVNEVQNRAQALYEEEMRKLSGGLPPLPFNLPGL
jgi:DNA-binding YbaB/EbfC family protein